MRQAGEDGMLLVVDGTGSADGLGAAVGDGDVAVVEVGAAVAAEVLRRVEAGQAVVEAAGIVEEGR